MNKLGNHIIGSINQKEEGGEKLTIIARPKAPALT